MWRRFGGAARGSFSLTGSNPSSDRCPLRRASLRVAESITGLCNWFERPVETHAAQVHLLKRLAAEER